MIIRFECGLEFSPFSLLIFVIYQSTKLSPTLITVLRRL